MITIKIKTDNDAFGEYPEQEVAKILRGLAKQFDLGLCPTLIKDINGNTVGTIKTTKRP